MVRHPQAVLPQTGDSQRISQPALSQADDGRRYTPFVLFGVIFWVLLLTVAVPVAEWPGMSVYLAVVLGLMLLLYTKGIKPVDPGFSGTLFALAVVAKLVGSTVRFWILTDVYDSGGDALTYFGQGQILADYYRDFDFSPWTWYVHGGEGTTAMIKLVGFLYAILPPNLPGSFFLY